jgi:anti-anti-sigma factor
MEIRKIQIDDTGILTLTGRLDIITAPKLEEALLEVIPSFKKIELEFACVDYVSSAGLRVLMLGDKNAKAAGNTMTIKNVSREVMKVFEITGFSEVLTII